MNLSSTDDRSDTFLNGCLNSFCTQDSTSGQEEAFSSLPSSAPTKEDPNMKVVSKLVRQDMNHLSLTERDQAYEDLHGVRQEVEENDELIAYSLQQMEEEILKIKKKATYVIAEQMSKEFVEDRNFRLMFLRSARFDAKVASQKFVNFFELKLELFGIDKLTKPITISDLDEEALFCLMSGKFQLLPYRDRSGRAIVCFFSRIRYPTQDVEAMLRATWYFLVSIMEDEETQRQGIVWIYCLVENHGEKELPLEPVRMKYVKRVRKFGSCLPHRTGGTHFCFNASKTLSVASTFTKVVQSQIRTRWRFHEGSDSECQFSLMTYGIPLHALPVTCSGDVKVGKHLKWIQMRRLVESAMIHGTGFNGIHLPKKYDILLGRGKPIQNSPGNERLREMVKESIELYNNAGKGEKTKVADIIVKQIRKLSCRFLKEDKKNSDGWVEVSDDIAREKVCALFRTVIGNECSRNSKNVVTNQDRKRVRY